MNAKLIALLIRSNATLVEVLGELSRQLDTAGNYSENNFWNLRQEIIGMAEEAEAMSTAELTTVVTGCPDNVAEIIENAVRNSKGFNSLREHDDIMKKCEIITGNLEVTGSPIMMMSPAHQKESVGNIRPSDLKAGTYYHGMDGANIPYFARIDGLSNYSDHIEGTERAVYSVSLVDARGHDVDQCPRMMHGHLILKEFRHW